MLKKNTALDTHYCANKCWKITFKVLITFVKEMLAHNRITWQNLGKHLRFPSPEILIS